MDLLVVVLAATSIWQSRLAAEHNAFIDAKNTSKLLTQNLVGAFDKFDASLILLKEEIERGDRRSEAADIEATAIRLAQFHRELSHLRVADADGRVILGTGHPAKDGINISTRAYFTQLRDNPDAGLVFSEPLLGYATGKWVIVMARSISSPSSSFAGVVFAVVTLQWIQDQFATVNIGSKGAIGFRGRDLSTVARYPAPETAGILPGNTIATSEWREKLEQSPLSGTYTAVSLDHVRRSLAYDRVGPYPFFVVVGLWPGDYLGEWWRDVLVTGLLAAVVLSVSGLVARAWYRRAQDSRRIAELHEQSLQQSRQHLDVAVDSAGMGTWVTLPLTGEMNASVRAKQLFGVSGDAPLDHDCAIAAICPEDQDLVRAAFDRAVHSGEPLDVRFRVLHPDGSIHWLQSRGQRLSTPGGGGQMIGVVQDVTSDVTYLDDLRSAKVKAEQEAQSRLVSEQKLRELTQSLEQRVKREVAAREAVQSRLSHAERMQAVGQLTGGIAHDFNNILTVITGTIDSLEQGVTDRPQLADIARMIAAASERGARLTASLLAFARKQPLQPRETDIYAMLMQACDLLRSTLGRQIEVELVGRKDVGSAFVDPDQLSSAIVNLGINARDAMPEGGKLTIEADVALIGQQQADAWEIVPGRYVLIMVSDTGTGIPCDIQDKIFEPFFTTKDTGKGTGLGLSMVFGFVKQSGGQIEFSSTEGVGTTFRIYLPAAGESGAAPLAMSRSGTGDGAAHGETILCVEDDPNVREMATLQLRKLGYKAIVATTPSEAMTFIADRNVAIDLLFTDIIMPGKMNGWKFAEIARKARPGLKVVYTSGYSNDEETGLPANASVSMLKKPYRIDDLARMLRQVIES